LVGSYLENTYFEGSESEWNALFTDYVGEGKAYSSIIEYLTNLSEEDGALPTMHYNVNY